MGHTGKDNGMARPSTVREFAGEIKRRLEALHPEYRVTVEEVLKNNGITLTGLSIMENESVGNASAIIYMDEYFELYQSGTDMEEICGDVVDFYRRNSPCPQFDTKGVMDWEKMKGQICFRLVNAEKNKELLKTLPHRPFLDLAVAYFIPIHGIDGGCINASITVSKKIMQAWEVDEDTLYENALRNTPRIQGSHVSPMGDVVKGLIQKIGPGILAEDLEGCAAELEDMMEENPKMYIAGNSTGMYGSAVLLNSDLLGRFAAQTGGDFYLLPSSINELIFVPDRDEIKDVTRLSETVRDVNRTVLSVNDFLSDSVYRYRAVDGKVEIAG